MIMIFYLREFVCYRLLYHWWCVDHGKEENVLGNPKCEVLKYIQFSKILLNDTILLIH
jgi:hypothetical protein